MRKHSQPRADELEDLQGLELCLLALSLGTLFSVIGIAWQLS